MAVNMQEFLRVWKHSMKRPIGAQSDVHNLLDLLGGIPGGTTQRARKRNLDGDGRDNPVNQFNLKGNNTAMGDGFQSTWLGDNSLIGSKCGHQRNFKGDNFLKGKGTDAFQSSWFGKNTAVVGGKSAIEQRNYNGNNTLNAEDGSQIKADQSTWHGKNKAVGPDKGKIDLTQRTLDGKNEFIQGDHSTSKTKQVAHGGENKFIGGDDSRSDHTFKGDKNKDTYIAGDRSKDTVKVDGNHNKLDIDTKDKDDHVKVGGRGHSGTIDTGKGKGDKIDLASLDHKGLKIKDKDGATINYGDKSKKGMNDYFKDNEYRYDDKTGKGGWYARGADKDAKPSVAIDGKDIKHDFGGKHGPMSHQELLDAQEKYNKTRTEKLGLATLPENVV